MENTKGALLRLGIAGTLAAGAAFAASPGDARIVKIEITTTESPTFKDASLVARSFGDVGPYEKLRGKAYGELDPADPRNAVITDIELAPRNTAGKVEYSMDIYILKPVDLSKGNHKLFMEVNNRGGKLFGPFNGSSGGNNPTTAEHAGDAFLMNQGYSLAWSGWDPGAGAGNNGLTITVPSAKNSDGSSITGPSYEYIVFDNATTQTSTLAYPAATLLKSQATLSVKQHLTDPAVTISETGWEYTSAAGTAIRLLPVGTAFQQSAIYEFSYTAKDPIVAGVGLAATRDFLSFLKYATKDDLGTPNPLAGHVSHAFTWTFSQPARYMNDFETFGFNADESGRKLVDGLFNWAGGGNGVFINIRFAQTGRTERNRQNHRYPEANFPFTYQSFRDPYTGVRAGRADRCSSRWHHSRDWDDDDSGWRHDRDWDDDDDRDGRHHDARDTCPKAMQVNSANEYWVKAGSLVHSDPRGQDLERDPKNVRFYLMSGVEHTTSGAGPNSFGSCQQARNTTNPSPGHRALFVALDKWVTKGIKPPESEIPAEDTKAYSIPLSDGVGYVPQRRLGWPDIPGVTYTGVITVRHLFDFGSQFDDGIMTINPPDFTGPVYRSFVSKVDRDGNEIAGIRLPPVLAPIGTTTGWALRRAELGGPDGCESSGQFIPFKTTKADRLAAGDPRLSLEERYKDHAGYVAAVTKAAKKLEKRRLLLPADVQRYMDDAQASTVLVP